MTILLLAATGRSAGNFSVPSPPWAGCGLRPGRMRPGRPDRVRAVVRQLRPGIIVNAAAYTAVDRAESEPELAQRINGTAPASWPKKRRPWAACSSIIRPITFSAANRTNPTGKPTPQSLQRHGRSKLAGRGDPGRRPRALIFRTSWVFGARGNFVKTVCAWPGARRPEDRQRPGGQPDSGRPDRYGHRPRPGHGATGSDLAPGRPGFITQPRRGPSVGTNSPAPSSNWPGAPGFCLAPGPSAVYPIPTGDYPTAARRPKNSRLDCRRLETDFGLQMPDWQPYLERLLQLLSLKQQGY